MINFKVGIMGAGNIAGIVADTLNQLDAFEPYAIASRSLDKANEFGDKYNIEKRYGSYEELVNDPDVELIYIATPHSHHAEQAKMCINAGKPCLVEKAFSYNATTAAEVFKLSEEKGVFCAEAMWIRFLPMYQVLADAIRNNVIGKINNIQCSLCYDLRTKERLIKPELAGGALLDLGVYPINLMCMMFGKLPEAISSSCVKLETGVDAQDVLNLNFNGGQSGTAVISMMYKADNNARIYGTNGYIEIDNINNPEAIRFFKADKELIQEVKTPSKQITGYEFQFLAARDAIILGETDTKIMSHKDSLSILGITDTLRKIWKMSFPMEPKDNGPELKKMPFSPTHQA